MEYGSNGVLKKSGKETEQEANTKTQQCKSTKEEGGCFRGSFSSWRSYIIPTFHSSSS
jgi:hypothetical protein